MVACWIGAEPHSLDDKLVISLIRAALIDRLWVYVRGIYGWYMVLCDT